MPNDIRETLTDPVIDEICSRFYAVCSPATMDEVKVLLSYFPQMNSAEDKQRILDGVEGWNMQLKTPIDTILTAYLLVKQRGAVSVAESTGIYVCTACKKATFRLAGQAIAPCECWRGKWVNYWEWAAEREADAEVLV